MTTDLIQNPDKTLIIHICYVLPIANDYRPKFKILTKLL